MSLLLLLGGLSGAAVSSLPAPVGLTVEGLTADVAVLSETLPRFSFLHGDASSLPRGTTQKSYRITVTTVGSDDEQAAKPLWDSGVVVSANCSEIEYAGAAALPAFQRFQWTAEWTASGSAGSSAQATAQFEVRCQAFLRQVLGDFPFALCSLVLKPVADGPPRCR
jgi:hypothetical protein